MTDKTPKIKYEVIPGEYLDIAGAFDRHPALHGIQLETDTESRRVSRAMTGETKTIHTTVGYGLWMSPVTFSALIKILNAAPVDGNPLNAPVNLWGDTTVSECEREDILYFLSDNGYDATLENIAAGYLYAVGNDDPLQIDVVNSGRTEYAVARVLSKGNKGDLKGSDGQDLAGYISLRLPKKEVLITSTETKTDLINFEGMRIGQYRIIHTLEPGGEAPLGGFILERITA